MQIAFDFFAVKVRIRLQFLTNQGPSSMKTRTACFTQRSVLTATALSMALLCSSAFAASPSDVKVMDFEGLRDFEPVISFYNGGAGGNGSGPGTNFGVSFSENSLALIDSDAGGSGNVGGEPSPDTVLFFVGGGAATMNVPAGFTTGFSFYYSAPYYTGSVVVYDGPNATGNILATLQLPLTPNDGAPDPSGAFSPLVPFGISFSGTAQSVNFVGTNNFIVFDNITLGTSNPEEPPATTCASEGFKGAQLTWCKNICENGLTGQVLDTWIHRWTNRYRQLPYCAVENEGQPQ